MLFHGAQKREAPVIDPGVGHHALAHDLAVWLSTPARGTVRGRLTWENVEFPDHRVRPDVYSLVATLAPKKVCPATYEVKVSRADFTTEIRSGKWRTYLPFSAYIFVACLEGLVVETELPPELGLIVRRAETWIVLQKGKRNPNWMLSERLWLNLCLKGRNPSPYEINQQRMIARAAPSPSRERRG